MPDETFTPEQFEQLARHIANVIGHDQFGMKDGDFALKLMRPPAPHRNAAWAVGRFNGIMRIYMNVHPVDTDFENQLTRALEATKKLKDTKMTGVMAWGGLRLPQNMVPSAYRKMYGLDPILDWIDLEVEIEYKVKVKHPITGLFVEEHGPVNKGMDRLKNAARNKLSEQVFMVLEKIKEQEKAGENGAKAHAQETNPAS